jgi:hypothetical protein
LINLLASPRRLRPRRGDARRFAEGIWQHLWLLARDNRWRQPKQIWLTTTDVAIDAPPRQQMKAGASSVLPVTIHNRSRLWISSDHPTIPMFCGQRWFTPDGAAVGDAVQPTALRSENVTPLGAIRPGSSRRISCTVVAPTTPGRYELRFGLVQQQFLWIDSIDESTGATVAVDVAG